MTDRVVVGSIAVGTVPGGNLEISITHTPTDRLVVEKADVADLLSALAHAAPVHAVIDSEFIDGLVRGVAEVHGTADAGQSLTTQPSYTSIVTDGKRVTVTVAIEGVALATFSLATEAWSTVESIHVRASGTTRRRMPNAEKYGAWGGIDLAGDARLGEDAIPWRRVGDIAKFVEGDGTDPQRIALADAIRQGVTR